LSLEDDCRNNTRLNDGSGRGLWISLSESNEIPLSWLNDGVPAGATAFADGDFVVFTVDDIELTFVETNVREASCVPWSEPTVLDEDN